MMMHMLWQTWWAWMAVALVLAIIEVVAPAFIFLGFAIGAALTGLLLLLAPAPSLPVLLMVFAALSLAAWLVLRRVFRLPKGQTRTFTHDINE